MDNDLPVIRLSIANAQMMPPVFRQMLEEAFVILSESLTARPFLEKARDEGVPVFYGRGMPFEGVYNPEKKVLVLGDQVEEAAGLAMTLCHELRHFSQITESGIVISPEYTPMTMLKMTLASEADARAHELQLAFEMSAKKTPVGKEVYPGVLDLTIQRLIELPDIRQIIADGQAHPEKVMNGRLMADAFNAFYPSVRLRYTTEDHLLMTMQSVPEMVESRAQFGKILSSAQILEATAKGAKPYISEHLKGIDLDDCAHASVFEKTAFQLEFMKAARDSRLGAKEEPGWKPEFLYGAARGNPRIILQRP